MRPCTVCIHPKRDEIDAAILDDRPYRIFAAHFGISQLAVYRHKANHLPDGYTLEWDRCAFPPPSAPTSRPASSTASAAPWATIGSASSGCARYGYKRSVTSGAHNGVHSHEL